jgi:uncharacterized caspase-like protein
LAQNEERHVKVLATAPWRDSGILVAKGEKYKITASGRWKTYALCNYAGPDGIGMYNLLCVDLGFGKVIEGYSHSALLAKIYNQGSDGTPFGVGSYIEVEVDRDGIFYFRVNEEDVWLGDGNEGEMNVVVTKLRGAAGVSATSILKTSNSNLAAMAKSYSHWAVIVGISNYQDTQIPSLRYADSDAKSFYNWLVSEKGGRYAPSRVKLLLNTDATGKNIKNALFNWLGQALEEDIVTIFFAGHGSPQSPDHPNNLFLLPYDSHYDDVATTGFPMWDIETALKRFIKSKKVVVIADACHSGGVGQAFDIARRDNRAIQINPISTGLQNLSTIGDGVAVISASDDKQFSQESKDWDGGHGVFTYFLLKGLKGDADYNKDGRVTLGELIPYLSEQVRRETRSAQSPTVAGKFDPALSIGR